MEPLTEREVVEILEELVRDRRTPPRVRVEAVRQWRIMRADQAPASSSIDAPAEQLAKLDQLDQVGQRRRRRRPPT
jgi:hypothetical protein